MSSVAREQTPMVVPSSVRDEVSAALGAFGNLRYYQREAIECCAWRLLKTRDPLLIVLPTGSGKSWVIAGLAALIRTMIESRTGKGKKILVLAPSAELITQNHSKMVEAGFEASIFMADLGTKDLSCDIVFGAPISIGNSVQSMVDQAMEFGAVVVDEAHEFTPKIQATIEQLSTVNPNLRVIGLTATPFRMGQGYIYARDSYRGGAELSPMQAKAPSFSEMVYEKTAEEMIEEGFLSPPLIGDVKAHYETGTLSRTASGLQFTEASSNKVFVDGKEDLTKDIVNDVIEKSRDRKGVMFFAQNRRHAREILGLLPKKQAAMIDSETDKRRDRPEIIQKFKDQKLRYLVSVGTLIKGFDCPHVEVVAILARTESDARLQQIIGRGLRLSPETGKRNCLILDYGENLPDNGDIFNPQFMLGKPGGGGGAAIEVECPTCSNVSAFQPATLPQDATLNKHGYLVSKATGDLVATDRGEPIAGHHATRCHHFYYPADDGLPVRCPQTWGTLVCPSCSALNGRRAEECRECGELIASHLQLTLVPKRPEGPFSPRLAKVVGGFRLLPGQSKAGNPTLRLVVEVRELPYYRQCRFAAEDVPDRDIKEGDPLADNDQETSYVTGEVLVDPKPETIQIWLNPTVQHPKAQRAWSAFLAFAQLYSPEPLAIPAEGVDGLLARFSVGHPRHVPIHAPAYITYCQQKTGRETDRVFYEILEYHTSHPYALEPSASEEGPVAAQQVGEAVVCT